VQKLRNVKQPSKQTYSTYTLAYYYYYDDVNEYEPNEKSKDTIFALFNFKISIDSSYLVEEAKGEGEEKNNDRSELLLAHSI
jgi:hypothetical protein